MTTGRLDGKIALITGSTGGIGAGIAECFAAEGAQVVVTGRNKEAGHKAVERIQAAGGNAVYVPLDVGDEQSVEAAIEATVDAFGGLDVLVNNAAATDVILEAQDGRCAEVTTQGFDTIVKVGLYGPFWCCHYAIPKLLQRGGGSIINISSAAAVQGIPKICAYTCSKGGLSALSRQLAFDYGADGIRVNTIAVGFVVSNQIAEQLVADETSGPAFAAVPVTPRHGRPADVAACAVYLASDDGEFVTGASIAVDGGMTIKSNFPDLVELFGREASS